MARRSISIDEKIERQKEAVAKAKDKYDDALNGLKTLMKKKQDLEGRELFNAFVSSEKSLEEILAFMSEKNANND
jgi:4-hydroxy-L-threonine phosphate dehydrogenase PdxA